VFYEKSQRGSDGSCGLYPAGASSLPIISEGFWESWEFFVIQIPLELGLGIWLLCGLFRKAGWLLGLISFGGFIIVTAGKVISGAESCGCFGTVTVDPLITLLTMDVPLFVLLAIFRPKGQKLLPPPWPSAKHFFGVAIPTFILLAVVVPVLILNKQIKPDYRQEWTTVKPIPNILRLRNPISRSRSRIL